LAQLYKYTDKDGKTVYTDQPPANVDSKRSRLQTAPAPAAARPPRRRAAKARNSRRPQGRKGRGEEGEDEREAQGRQRGALRERAGKPRVGRVRASPDRVNAKGEVEYLDETEIEANKAARRPTSSAPARSHDPRRARARAHSFASRDERAIELDAIALAQDASRGARARPDARRRLASSGKALEHARSLDRVGDAAALGNSTSIHFLPAGERRRHAHAQRHGADSARFTKWSTSVSVT
jgi:hypothetical protein